MKSVISKRVLIFIFIIAVLVSSIVPANAQTKRYYEYKMGLPDNAIAEGKIVLNNIENCELTGDVKYSALESALCFGETDGTAKFNFSIQNAGLYNMKVTYKPFEGITRILKSSIGLFIDDILPFTEAECVYLARPWKNSNETRIDSRGNEIAPEQEECNEWFSQFVIDPNGNENYPYEFYLESGNHSITISSITTNAYISKIELIAVEEVMTYSEYKTIYSNKISTDNVVGLENKYIQAEDFIRKSDSTMVASSDKSDSKNMPVDAKRFLLNIVSGDSFQKTGQWMEWEIEVPNDGYYNISLRVKQDAKSGKFCSRRLYIDGEIPFKECEEIQIPYNTKWQLITISDSKENCLFYLEKGIHTIRLEAVSGIYGDIYIKTQQIITKLNNLYNQVIMICGTQPDEYRDYKLDVELPELKQELFNTQNEVENIKNEILKISGGSGSEISTLNSLIQTLTVYSKDLDKIPNTIDSFRSDIESLATWNSSLTAQPVSIDYLYFSKHGEELPKANSSFLQTIWFNIRKWLASYTEDYGIVGDIQKSDKQLSVWIGTGRDQLKICKDLIDNKFTSDSKVSVNLQITPTSIISAIMAGTGPDVSLFESSEIPVALASKNALLDLKMFEDFNKVEARFMPGTTAPLYHKGGCYGIPLTESFPMMFVRTDIFSQLGLKIPQTWDDLYNTVAVLQRKNLDFALPTHIGTFMTMLYQYGGRFYSEDRTHVELSSQEAKSAFVKWTDFFCKYSFPVSYDFYNRFRSGQMPIGIADYTLYSTFKAAAPEIQGMWEMLPVPGIMKENGQIDHTVSICSAAGSGSGYGLLQTLSCAIILKDSDMKSEAWEFIKWFSSAEVQAEYGNQIECVLGEAGRYTPANIEAFKLLPWTTAEKTALLNAWENVKIIEEIPGNYYTARYLVTAFRNVVYDDTVAIDTLNKYEKIINKELERKYK